MLRALQDDFGNPSSVHAEGSRARATLARARSQVATLLGVAPGEVLLTGCATESNNTVVRCAAAARERGRHIVTSQIEHPSVEAPLAALEARGWRVTRVGVGADGRVDPRAMEDAIGPETALVTLIWANNETGILQPVAEVAERARARGVWFHSDATQAVGKVPVDLGVVPVDLLSLSAHKLGGPKGVGALVVREGIEFEGLLLGGPQERRRRGGTENVAGIAGLGVACALAQEELPERMARDARLRDRLWQGIREKIPRVRRNGSESAVLPTTLSVAFEGAAGEVLLQALDLEGIAVSSGAACASGSIEASPVLLAMGCTPEDARATLRLSVGHGVDESQIDRVLAVLPDRVARVREADAA